MEIIVEETVSVRDVSNFTLGGACGCPTRGTGCSYGSAYMIYSIKGSVCSSLVLGAWKWVNQMEFSVRLLFFYYQ